MLRRLLISATTAATIIVASCDRSPAQKTSNALGASADAVPAGIDPQMVERREDGVVVASRDSLLKTPGYIVDSIFPPEETLRRFRADFSGAPPTSLDGSMRSRDDLLRRYWRILTSGDTTGAGALVLTKREFAYLYLPASPEFKAGMPPQIAWLLLERSAPTAFSKAREVAVTRRTGAVVGTTCPPVVGALPGELQVFGPCGVIIRSGASRDTMWIASRVVAHRGIVKLLSHANPL